MGGFLMTTRLSDKKEAHFIAEKLQIMARSGIRKENYLARHRY